MKPFSRFARAPIIPARAASSSLIQLCITAVLVLRTLTCSAGPFADKPPAKPGPAETKPSATTVQAPKSPADGAPQKEAEWKSLFDGKTLTGWKITDFAGTGKVEVQNGQIMLRSGLVLTGVTWTNEVSKTNYEITLEAMKVEGADFFCCLTFPVGNSHCSFVAGGWGGAVAGISNIDGMDASENETTKFMNFEKNRWYRIRVRVTPAKIETWVDDEKFVDQPIEDRKISMRPGEIELSAPLGVATYQTTAALRNMRMRTIGAK